MSASVSLDIQDYLPASKILCLKLITKLKISTGKGFPFNLKQKINPVMES